MSSERQRFRLLSKIVLAFCLFSCGDNTPENKFDRIFELKSKITILNKTEVENQAEHYFFIAHNGKGIEAEIKAKGYNEVLGEYDQLIEHLDKKVVEEIKNSINKTVYIMRNEVNTKTIILTDDKIYFIFLALPVGWSPVTD